MKELTDPVSEPTLKEKVQRLFVYGTLRRGQGNDSLLRYGGSKFLEEVWVYEHAMFGSPLCVKPAEPTDRVRGEIWEVPTWLLLRSVDQLEYHPYAWKRTWIPNQHNGIWIYIDQSTKRGQKFIDGDITSYFTLMKKRLK